jgi:hypothetical protein
MAQPCDPFGGYTVKPIVRSGRLVSSLQRSAARQSIGDEALARA